MDYEKTSSPLDSNMPKQIPHYYGDRVRALFIVAAALWLLVLPFYPSILPFYPFLQVPFIVLLVIFAALTSPKKMWVMMYNVLLAALGVVIFEITAIYFFQEGTIFEFLIREVLVILFLAALYFSLKTVRAMYSHQIGKKSEFT